MAAASSTSEGETSAWPRVRCCGKSYSYYCPVCYKSLAPPGVAIPDVTLPLSVAVMLKDGRQRSTAMHAPVLAPRDVRVYEHPYAGLPEFDAESCVVRWHVLPQRCSPPGKQIPRVRLSKPLFR